MVPFAVIGSIFLAFIYIALTLLRTAGGAYLLVISYQDEAAEKVNAVITGLAGKLKNKTRYKESTEVTLQVKVKKNDTAFLEELNQIAGVNNCVLVEFTGE